MCVCDLIAGGSAVVAMLLGWYCYSGKPEKGGVSALDKDVVWFAKAVKDRFRWNLLNPLPLLRQVRC